jgi:hypothetical protein
MTKNITHQHMQRGAKACSPDKKIDAFGNGLG